MNKFEQQDAEYHFPYHYIPEYKEDGISRTRHLGWGVSIWGI